jgi:hypothetical protein
VEREHDVVRGRNLVRRTQIKDGVVGETATTFQRLYATTELISMAKSVGFIFRESYGDFDGSPLHIDSGRAILYFEKH